ncbi:endopeptidase La [Cocleimonas flava]|uniref:Lon protease n=1 Tax=Cocleimonas flava TaxID=634765 RepID=A0A4V2P965_9GAMM|nr:MULTISPECIES: endopeptidase La [Cocleimonas]MEB8430724.1 endopeptidase La [Cocleimonas sp. KMM 6892]MEC4714504.1 endopeptidase La [Cocleimonas sp. KMM 6895]MEC4743837.1 endopeptidase La [Cocleimonas sp. KMM 6896]TCJ88425.1 ATP-dependent Lon protease [Cocleimonas flava]
MATEKENNTANAEKNIKGIPVLTLRDVVVYPHMVIPLFVGREKSIRSLDEAMENNKQILLVAQKSAEVDEPGPDDIFEVGTLATILQLLKLPDGTLKVLVEGVERVKIASMDIEGEYFTADIDVIPVDDSFDKRKTELLSRALVNLFDKYVNLNKKVPPEILSSLSGIDEPDRLSDAIAAHLGLKVTDKQKILEITSVKERLEHLVSLVEGEIDLLQVEKRIRGRVKQQMDRSQREYYLNEQMKAIQKELGDLDDAPSNELEQLAEKLEKAKMPKEAKEKAEEELKKLKMMSPMSAEATVVRNYIDWMVGLPWSKKSKICKDLAKAQKVLDEDHYGLDEVKERIVEYLAVQQRVKKLKGPIMCLVGPPGVGKTSLGKSLAKATGRNYTRMALGGVRDEAEIRGHRRTYIGALPGKIIQNLSRVKTRNPLFLLDEIDKMATDFRGDPASAMLEVLDPEQNNSFADHYLEVDFDLSDVMFVATSNSMNIPGPLLDRMEIIRIPGYTEDEKLNIAKNYLVPKQFKDNGVEKGEVTISDSAILSIIRHYTREAGVRSLEREVSKICRKVIREHLLGKKTKTSVTGRNISKYLGVQRFDYGKADKKNQVGQVTGLAWTSVGGELLTIESVVVSGNGHVKSTGSLGKVMQESIQAAETVVKSRSRHLGITQKFLKKKNVHIHVPEGATPKDGPSAGVGMVTAIVSSMTGIPVKAEVAMTGEITLRGEVLPIGGLKEKLLAAHRGGITTVLIPAENEKDLADVPDNVKKGLSIKPVKWIDEVLEIALESMPEEIDEEDDLEDDVDQSTQSQNNPDQEEESRAH